MRVRKRRRMAPARRAAFKRKVMQRRTMRLGHVGELKFFDATKGSTTTSATGAISNLSLNLVPQGITEVTRIGRRIMVKSLFLHGNVTLPSTATVGDTADSARVIVYLDKQANKATAATTDIMEATISIDSFRNLANKGRFRILSDRKYDVWSGAGAGEAAGDSEYGEMIISWDVALPSLNIPIEFTAETGAITEITSNNIGVMVIGRSAKCGVGYKWRLRYTDF